HETLRSKASSSAVSLLAALGVSNCKASALMKNDASIDWSCPQKCTALRVALGNPIVMGAPCAPPNRSDMAMTGLFSNAKSRRYAGTRLVATPPSDYLCHGDTGEKRLTCGFRSAPAGC